MWQYNYSNELMHYGVLGMKWGIRHLPMKVQKRYAQWRIKRHNNKSQKYTEKADNNEFKSWLNLSYVMQRGLAKAHEDRFEYYTKGLNFCNAYLNHDGSLLSALSDADIKTGKLYIDNILID